jgi:hypothetical protein
MAMEIRTHGTATPLNAQPAGNPPACPSGPAGSPATPASRGSHSPPDSAGGQPAPTRIIHQASGAAPRTAVEFREPTGNVPPGDGTVGTTPSQKIRTFGAMKRHEDEWARTPNLTGQGAIHVKTFHAKLTEDSLVFLDQSVNEWLDAHPQYEVKFISTTIGEFTGKVKEPHLICMVWV